MGMGKSWTGVPGALHEETSHGTPSGSGSNKHVQEGSLAGSQASSLLDPESPKLFTLRSRIAQKPEQLHTNTQLAPSNIPLYEPQARMEQKHCGSGLTTLPFAAKW